MRKLALTLRVNDTFKTVIYLEGRIAHSLKDDAEVIWTNVKDRTGALTIREGQSIEYQDARDELTAIAEALYGRKSYSIHTFLERIKVKRGSK